MPARRVVGGIAVTAGASALIAALHPSPVASVSGTVFDSTADAPLAGATVQLVSDAAGVQLAHVEVTTDARGRFTATDVAPGRYRAGFFHPRLDTIGVDMPLATVTVPANGTADLALAVPSVRTLVAAVCGGATATDSSTLFIGHLKNAATDAPVAGATVYVSWAEVAISQNGLLRRYRSGEATSRDDGRFVICNAPKAAQLTFRAVGRGDSTGVLSLAIPERRIVARDLLLGVSHPSMPDSDIVVDSVRQHFVSARTGNATLRVTVHTDDGKPVPGARVRVLGAAGEAVSSAEGRIVLAGLPSGTWAADFRAIGYEPTRVLADLGAVTDATPLTVTMAKQAYTLDAARIITGPANTLIKNGFEERRSAGFGHFVDRKQLDVRRPFEIKDMLLGMPSVEVRPHIPGGGPALLMHAFGGLCQPLIFIDNVQYPKAEGEEMISLLNPDIVSGIEVYSHNTEAPLQFADNLGGCGSVVVWTDPSQIRKPVKPPG